MVFLVLLRYSLLLSLKKNSSNWFNLFGNSKPSFIFFLFGLPIQLIQSNWFNSNCKLINCNFFLASSNQEVSAFRPRDILWILKLLLSFLEGSEPRIFNFSPLFSILSLLPWVANLSLTLLISWITLIYLYNCAYNDVFNVDFQSP